MFTLRTPRPFRDLALTIETLLHGKLWLQALVGLGLGLGFGLLLGPDAGLFRADEVRVITEWIALPGDLFLRLITMVLIPLVAASIIRGLGGTTDPENLRKTGVLFFLYAISTSLLAAILGVVLASIVHPGAFVSLPLLADPSVHLTSVPMEFNFARDFPETIVNLVPANPLAAAINGELLGIVIFSVIVGIAFAMQHNHKIEPLLTFLDGVLEVCITIVKWAMWLVPLAVFGLMARMVAQVGIGTLIGVGVYVFTVLLGLLILLGFYLLLVRIFGHLSPDVFLRKILPAQILAFSTSSSAAVMPLSVKIAEDELGIKGDTAKIIIPLGAMINMAGTALYQGVAILFLAEMSGMDLSLLQMVAIVFTLVLSSIGAPATPGAGMIILGSVATTFGIPTEGLVLILGVDRILDMCRTTLNVTGDLVACVLFGQKKKMFAGWGR